MVHVFSLAGFAISRSFVVPLQLLQEMPKKGIRVCGRSFTFAMAACLESHRDTQTAAMRKSPPDTDLRLSEAALFLFDQLEEAGETPSASTYALALKVRLLITPCSRL